jgi:hypothetical protein
VHDPPAPPVSESDAASDDVEILTEAFCPANSSEPDFKFPAPPPMCWKCLSAISPVFPVCNCAVVRSN